MARGILSEKQDNRILYYDRLRIAATLAVIILHLATQSWASAEVTSSQWRALNLWDSAVRWSVPVFVMISGALFLDPARKITTEKLYKNNIWHIVTAFLFWSVIYALYNLVSRSGWTFHTFLMAFLTGYYHMWFLFMIVGLYILVPVLRRIASDRKTMNYFLILTLIFAFVIPTIRSQIVPFSAELSSSDGIRALFSDYDSMRFHMPLGFTGYFLAGYYLQKRNLTKEERIGIYVLGVVGFIITCFATRVISTNLGKANSSYYEYISLNVLMESVAVFVLFKQTGQKISEKNRKKIEEISSCTFGIYLVHVLIMEILQRYLKLSAETIHPAIAVPVLAVLIFAGGYYVTRGLKKLKKFSKYIT